MSTLSDGPATDQLPPAPTGPSPSLSMAGWALGLSVFPISLPIAAALAVVTLKRGRPERAYALARGQRWTGEVGRTMSIIALCMVVAWGVVLPAVLIAISSTRSPGEATEPPTSEKLVASLHIGDCMSGALRKDRTSTFRVVPCAQQHDGYVYARFALAGAFPGAAEVDRLAEAGCVERLRSDAPTTTPVLFFTPRSAASWDRDPSVVCLEGSPPSGGAG